MDAPVSVQLCIRDPMAAVEDLRSLADMFEGLELSQVEGPGLTSVSGEAMTVPPGAFREVAQRMRQLAQVISDRRPDSACKLPPGLPSESA